MERQRKYKMFSIIALMFAICALSIGYAAFSKVLTINSSATVTPNEEDFNIMVYGFKNESALQNYFENFEFSDIDLSDTFGLGYTDSDLTGTPATIKNDSKNATISNISANINKNDFYYYFFVLKNEGKYDAYINLKDAIPQLQNNICIGGENANQQAIDAACKNIKIELYMCDPTGDCNDTESRDLYELKKNEYAFLEVHIGTFSKDAIISESYTVNFDKLTINFSTTQ